MYSSLHTHSMYSLLDGFGTPKEMLERASKIGLKAIGITEHGNEYSHIYYDRLSKDYPDIKILFGEEFYECFDRTIQDKNSKYFHLIALARNEQGRKALNKLTTLSNLEGFYFKPRITIEDMKPYGEDLIVCSACLASKLARESDYNKCVEYVSEYKNIFPYFYLEMQSHTSEYQAEYNKKILQLSKDTNTPYIITTDAHAATKEDLYYQGRHVQIAHDSETISESYEGCYLQTEEEIHNIMDDQIGKLAVNQGLQETNNIADLCEEVHMPFQPPQLPTFPLPEGFDDNYTYLKHLINLGWESHGFNNLSDEDKEIYKTRLDYELSIIHQMGFDGYFLIVWDFINYAKSHDVMVGSGRGCFTGDALVWCKDCLKRLDAVKIGDEVLTDTGTFEKVLNTFKYDIKEDMIQIEYQKQGSINRKYPMMCTKDHKILVNRDGKNQYIEAEKIQLTDLLCYPKIKDKPKYDTLTFDLQKYNDYGYDYDDKFVYEMIPTNHCYKYSSHDLFRRGICTTTFAQKMAKCEINEQTKNIKTTELLKKFYANTPFTSQQEYAEYCNRHRYTRRKINRYFTVDEEFCTFVGLMYGDGWVRSGNGRECFGIACNSNNHKNIINKEVFFNICNKLGYPIEDIYQYNNSGKLLTQYVCSGKILPRFFSDILFVSKKGQDKQVNGIWYDLPNNMLKNIFNGLILSDGSTTDIKKISFDNTSLSIISYYKYLCNKLEIDPMGIQLREEHTDSRGIHSKDSYKLSYNGTGNKNKINNDDDYWYLKIKSINKIYNYEGSVYDITVDKSHSYVIHNAVVHNSCAGSLVCFTIGITDLNPIKYGLIFERFLNPERISMPDTDTDVSNRAIVIDYLINKYGAERVCQIINFSYITPVVAIKDVGKVLGFKYNEMDKLSKKFTYETFQECLDNNETLVEDNPQYAELFDIASHLSGRVKTVSCHAGGVGIVDTEINDYLGMKLGSKGEHVIQVDKRNIEDIGIIKFDILGVQTLTMVKEILTDLEMPEYEININNPKFEYDEKPYKLLSKGLTNGVFQTESAGMRDLLLRLQPKNMEDISAVLALYRPDTMGALDEYIEARTSGKKSEYIHQDMAEILDETMGCLLYQEQLMNIVRKFGGRTYGGSDKFRKAIGKKNVQLVKEESAKLYNEIKENGYDETIAKRISDDMSEKGGYLFNKSHSYSYAVLCLQTAYLKTYYPLHFFKALFNLNKDKAGMVNKYIIDAKNFNISVLPPNINKSKMNFSVEDNAILFGLSAITGIGENVAKEIINERETNGLFKNTQDFLERTNLKKSQLISLIKAGAIPTKNKKKFLINYLKTLYEPLTFKPVAKTPSYKELIATYGIDVEQYRTGDKRYDYDKDKILDIYNQKKKEIFDEQQKQRFQKYIDDNNKYLENEDFWEFEALQIFINNNPFEQAYSYMKEPFEEVEEGQECTVIGVIAKVQKKKDKNKKQFAYANIYSSFGLIEALIWHSQLKEYEDLIVKGKQIAMLCKKDGEDKVTCKKIKPYQKWLIDIKKQRGN